ncbi:APC family permease [Heliophilum fasciatum]|uniref:Amino acid/polyamine/organocation transporter (APC superfamily) n=1 Tax=Heliophilum fasciatum TaxID=35700 RepID=A0A4R2RS13_9FIRM|nr:APC family permease [Heliophilum fasciatum]MCW2278617.1 amino acid transporter [Heliophilum fasciatum]TCP62681.1 amino acid/polyamine/organocation transporter (APC superfamily) [Heliophilum fasciatum]
MSEKNGKLNELAATAICGNDITSSCLYVSALAIAYAGKWAWVSLLMVSLVLFMYRKIYAEVVGALPLNGGAYNALLNTTSKFIASLAACFTLLSYMATAVISANEAMHYLHTLWVDLPVVLATIALLALFMALTIIGIGESAKVATGIFLLHLTTLGMLIVTGFWIFLQKGTAILMANYALPIEGSIGMALFFGFSAAMLGISGFESSANFVEEQERGVFPKTLRNMWLAVTVINPSIAFLALALLPMGEILGNKEALLSYLGGMAGGPWLTVMVAVDAALVLSGAVLTSYVGVTGLVHRMVLDRCLPQYLLKKNRYGTQHRIVIAFFVLCVSVLLVTAGELPALAGVYSLSFLAVMALFGIGNLLLKIRRGGLNRPVQAAWPVALLAIGAVLAALTGTVIMNPKYVQIFLQYFLPTVIIVFTMLNRIALLEACLFLIRAINTRISGWTSQMTEMIETKVEQINSQQVVFFTRGADPANLNLALQYVRNNEHTNRIKIVTIVRDGAEVPPRLYEDVEFFDRVYPEIDIEVVVIEGKFSPELVQELSQSWGIPMNFMFMGSPGAGIPYNLAELGGVRLII